jgi:signal transduction histidine kinase
MSSPGESRVTPVRAAVAYAGLGLAWILGSDLLVAQVFPPAEQLASQLVKGTAFVVLSAGVVYYLVDRSQHQLAEQNRQLELAVKRVSILHRVLRHDLRNCCNIALGHVESLEDDVGDDDRIEKIRAQAERMLDLSDRSERIREVTTSQVDAVDAVAAVREAVTRADTAGVTVTVSLPETPVRVDARIDVVAEELVANAVANADSVDVDGRVVDDRFELTVADDGEGLPRLEARVLTAEYEEPMVHSRGLGLWTVRFITTAAGGSFDARDREPTGTVVTVSLPRSSG